MDLSEMNYYRGFLFGLVSMVYFHNFVLSLTLYRKSISTAKSDTNPTTSNSITNILKVIFNFLGLALTILNLSLFLLDFGDDHDTALRSCDALIYADEITNFGFRESLAAFLLWRVAQFRDRIRDRWCALGFFFVRAILNILQVAFVRPSVKFNMVTTSSHCTSDTIDNQVLAWCCIAMDFVISGFVMQGLYNILKRGNKTGIAERTIPQAISRRASFQLQKRKRQRILFTIVMLWNFLRVVLSILLNSLTIWKTLLRTRHQLGSSVGYNTLNTILLIAISHAVSVNAEIVPNNNATANVKSFKKRMSGDSQLSEKPLRIGIPSSSRQHSITEMPITPLATKDPVPPLPPPSPPEGENDVPTSLGTGEQKEHLVVSMRRLSFLDWANFMAGRKSNVFINTLNTNNDNDSNNEIREEEEEEGGKAKVDSDEDRVSDKSWDEERGGFSNMGGIMVTTTTTTTTTATYPSSSDSYFLVDIN